MLSPFPPSSSKPGHGEVHLTLLPPAIPTFGTLAYTYPLKLLPSTPHILTPASEPSKTPSSSSKDHHHRPPTTVPLLFLLTYGGGLLAGDAITLTITLDAGTRLAITTQGSTKIYRPPLPSDTSAHPSPPTTHQTLLATISTGAALWLAPDPVQPFAGSLYAQRQIFDVVRGGSLGVVDWVSEGRSSRGERWGGETWRGRNEVWTIENDHTGDGGEEKQIGKKRTLLVRDAVILEGPNVKARMDGMGVFGTVLLRGPLFEGLGAFFVGEFAAMPRIGGRNWDDHASKGGEEGGGVDTKEEEEQKWRKLRWEREKRDGVLWTACKVRGVFVVKFSAREVEGARCWLGDMLRREGMVGREFGDGGLMFVR